MKKLAKKICLLMPLILLCALTLPLSVEAADQQPLVYVKRDIILNSYGYLLLNDTLTFVNTSPNPLRLPTLTLTYPTTTIDLQVQPPLSEDSVKVERLGNLSSSRIGANLMIAASSNLTITLRAVLGDLLKPVGENMYEMILPLPSSPDTQLAEAVVTVSFPTDINLVNAPEEFKLSEGGSVWSAELKDIQPTAEPRTAKLLINGTDYSLTVLKVEREERVVKITSPTEVTIFDTLTLVNKGSGTLSYLKVSDKGLSSVTLLRGDIPLRDQKVIPIIGGSLDLYSLIKGNLKAGEKITFTISYTLPERATVSDNTITLKIPQKPLIDALVTKYYLIIDAPQGCKVEGPTLLDLSYSSPLSNKEINVSVRFGAAWASAYAFPAATLIFLASFIALSAYVASRKEAKEHPLLELIKLYENALNSQETIADELAAERLERLQIQKIDLFAQQIKEIRAKTSLKASQIRSKLTLDPKTEEMLTEFTSLDKAYERTLTELLAAYRNYLSGKLKREAFQKVLSDKSSSLRKLASTIRDLLDEMS